MARGADGPGAGPSSWDWSEAQRVEGAGEQGRDGEQPERGQHTQHQGEQQFHRDAPSGLLGASPAIEARVDRQAIECRQQGRAVSVGAGKDPHERPA